jgi:hypothetical protein
MTCTLRSWQRGRRRRPAAAAGRRGRARPPAGHGQSLIERLDPDDDAAVGIEPSRMAYRALGDLDGADEKTIRDAGPVAVARIDAALAS